MPKFTNKFERLLNAYHEAGHAVVAWDLGVPFKRIRVDEDVARNEFVPPDQFSIWQMSPDEHRKMLTVFVAGNVAGFKHQREVDDRGFSSREERRGYERVWNHLVSIDFTIFAGKEKLSPGLDLYKAMALGQEIFMREGLSICFTDSIEKQQRDIKRQMAKAPKFILKEIKAAEKRADAILKKRWDCVEKVVATLTKRANGVLTHKQFLKLVGVPTT